MALLINNVFVFIFVLAAGCRAKQHRFDYEWSNEAPGWLKYHAVPATWDEARLRCFAEGAILASPLTNQMKAAIVTFAKKHSRSESESHIFTGVHAIFSKGDYSSIEGVPLLRLAISWDSDEPDNHKNSESCLAMSISKNGAMADTRCDRVLPYVCYEKDTKMNITECGTTDSKYVKENRTGSCYKFHERGRPWSEAYKTCIAEGGYLAIINNDVEAGVVREIIAKHWNNVFAFAKGFTYVGIHDWGHHGVNFMTIHGETLDANYHKWHSGEPNNITRAGVGPEGESCGSVYNDVQLNDYMCGVPTGFLCEKMPKSLASDFDIKS